MLVAAGAILFLIGLTANPSLALFLVSQKCVDCICETKDHEGGTCNWDGVSDDNCGPCNVTYSHWKDCGRPGGGWGKCATQTWCAITCLRNYVNSYAPKCTRPREPKCKDYARVRIGGPNGCKKKSTIGYGNKVMECCKKKGGC